MGEVSQSDSGAKKGGKKPKGKKMSTHIDMTPMVDLAFLLLTFFMLATSFSKPKTMEIIMPDKPDPTEKAPEINEAKVMNVILGPNDRLFYYLGLKPEDMQEIKYGKGFRDLLYNRKKVEGSMVLIKADDKARYANIVTLFDEMNITEQERYALVDLVDREKAELDKKIAGE